jgi:aquaporin Z
VLPTAFQNGANLGVPALGTGTSAGVGVVVEAVLTFFLTWVVFATAVDPRGTFKQIAGLAIGLTIAFDVLMAYQLTGAAMNPARAFGPQIAGNHWSHFWVWYVGPCAGAVIAASVYELLYLRPPQPQPVGPAETGVEEPGAGEAARS